METKMQTQTQKQFNMRKKNQSFEDIILLDTNNLLSDQHFACSEIIRSIIKGIEMGDNIPPIEVVRINDVIEAYPHCLRKSILSRGSYVIYNGTHRALAHYRTQRQVLAKVFDYTPDLWRNVNQGTPVKLSKIFELNDIERYLKRIKMDFYREIEIKRNLK